MIAQCRKALERMLQVSKQASEDIKPDIQIPQFWPNFPQQKISSQQMSDSLLQALVPKSRSIKFVRIQKQANGMEILLPKQLRVSSQKSFRTTLDNLNKRTENVHYNKRIKLLYCYSKKSLFKKKIRKPADCLA